MHPCAAGRQRSLPGRMGPEGGLGQPSVRPHKVKFFIFAKAFILLYFSRPTTRMVTDRGQIDRDVVFQQPRRRRLVYKSCLSSSIDQQKAARKITMILVVEKITTYLYF